jgi:hypothetical protein
MRWYKVENRWSSGIESSKQIIEVEVDRFTESSVWIGGKRMAIHTAYEAYFPTQQAAIDYCEAFFQQKLESARKAMIVAGNQLMAWREYLADLVGMEGEEI